MKNSSQIKSVQKKFKHFVDQSPIYYFQTFDCIISTKLRTHYIISQSTCVFLGYMQKCFFNQLLKLPISCPIASSCLFLDTLYLGLQNGTILYASLDAIYKQIPFQIIQLGDPREVVGLVGKKDQDSRVGVVTLDDKGTFKAFYNIDGQFRIVRSMETHQVFKVCAKATSDLNKPSFMVCFKDANLPILLSLYQIQRGFTGQQNIQIWKKIRSNYYFDDQKPKQRITSIDFLPQQMRACIGTQSGQISLYSIQSQTVSGLTRCFLIKQTSIKQRQISLSLCLRSSSLLACINNYNICGINTIDRRHNTAKIKNQQQKRVTCIRWTKDKDFLIASVSSDGAKFKPKVYCVQQDVKE